MTVTATADADVQTIVPDPDATTLTLNNGAVVSLRELRSEETFLFLRIITKGLGTQADQLGQLDPDDEDAFAKKLAMLALMALPNAFPETAAFIRAMVYPHGLLPGRKLNKADKERNEAAVAALDDELANPSLEDLLSVVEAVVLREAPHLAALGKRLAGMITLARRTGATR